MQPLSSDDPAQIGQYRLRGRLGAGGMGLVYLASTPAGRLVALKVVRPELSGDQEFRARFRQEIQAARRVRGLYTAELVDADPDASPPWLATAYVPGPSLKQFVDENGPVPEAEAFRLIAGVAEALQAIHSAGVVHRDLKPSNVVLGPDGPRVIDFGIARALEAVRLTRTGAAVGTPGFIAPEQLLDQPVTPMIDVFALGSLAAYAVLGRPPFGGGHDAAVSYRVLHGAPDLTGCSPRLRALIEPCLAKQPADRPQLSQILRFCLGDTDMAAGLAPDQALYLPAGMVADSQATPPLPTMTAGAVPQFPPTGRHGRPVPPRRAIKGVRLIYLGGLLAVGVVVVAVINILPAISAVGHQKGTVGGKTVAPTGPCLPTIKAVGTFEATATQTVKITGSCFGVGNVSSERDTAYFRISDQTAGWNACWTGDPNGGDYLTCDILSWTNQEITFTGFAGAYGQDGSVSGGDHMEIQVWNPQSGKGPATHKVVAVSAQ